MDTPRTGFRTMHWVALAAIVTVLALGAGALLSQPGSRAPAPLPPDHVDAETLATIPHLGRPGDGFVGSDACKQCHEDEHGSWHRSYHRTMTQAASRAAILADFDGREIENRGRRWRLASDGTHQVELADDARPGGWHEPRRVVMVTGSHHQQVYWLAGEGPGREPEMLPFVYLIAEKRWIPREDAFVVPPGHPEMASRWNDGCIRCHATGGQPKQDTRGLRFETRVAELGIACEACHGPGEAHATLHALPAVKQIGKPVPDVVHPLELPQVQQAQVCGQCHAVSGPPSLTMDRRWLVEGYPYRPGDDLWATRGITRHPAKAAQPAPRVPAKNFPMSPEQLGFFFWPDGMVRVSGREYNGLLESACYQRGAMTCMSCHQMHGDDPNDQLAPGARGDDTCLDCHAEIAKDIPAHTHHGLGSTGSACMNCHMPHTTWGLTKAIRSHQISSPSVAESRAPIRRPNACNLCHLDRTLGWTADKLQAWYGHPRPKLGALAEERAASLVWLHKGDGGQRALLAWHMGWAPARAASGADWLAPHLSMAAASDPYAQVRYRAARSLRSLPGFETWTYDFLAPQAERSAAGKAAFARWQALPRPAPRGGPALLQKADGSLDLDFAMRLQGARDNRPVFLGE